MPTKNRPAQTGLACLVILIILACNMPGAQPPQEVTTPNATLFIPPASTSYSSATPNIDPTLSLVPTIIFTNNPAHTPTFTPTNTPLPPLPDFEDVLSFGGGGGGPPCTSFKTINAISTDVTFGKYSNMCMIFLGMDFNKPFHLQLTSPNGRVYTSPNLRLNQNTKAVQWEGYQGFNGSAEWSGNGILYVSLSTWWPSSLSEGQWQVQAYGDSFLASGSFSVTRQRERSYITAVDSRSEAQIMPGVLYLGLHPVKLKDNGRMDVIGKAFPANTEIYVLLYRYIRSPTEKAELVQKLSVISDSAGLIQAEFSGPFEKGQSYLVIGLSDPNTPLSGGVLNSNPNFPSDFFVIDPETVTVDSDQTSSSCPGAPAQRMIVNQRGYVCTQTDSVRLRNSPQKSAGTIVQLAKGTQFTVIGGPSCADNWSWWQVKTDNDLTGWISEGGDSVDPYFICPIP